jgi:hypothetical protein
MMKRITLLFAAFIMAAFCANAQTLNNPKDANGYFIVKWDCANETWAASNDFEVDEAFTFAVDVTGTVLDDWLKETPTNAGATRGIAINRWSGFGDFKEECNRLKQIRGNIYGTTWCFTQFANTFDEELATALETVTYFSMQVFGFEYTSESTGVDWYVLPIGIDAVEGIAFTSAPYTGTKTSAEFYADDYDGFWPYTAGGYAPTCVTIPPATGIHPVTVDSPVVGHEYYNLQGMKLSKQPENGLFIDKAKKADGSSTAQKVLKSLK